LEVKRRVEENSIGIFALDLLLLRVWGERTRAGRVIAIIKRGKAQFVRVLARWSQQVQGAHPDALMGRDMFK